jgi:hypothetical protein
MLGTFWLKLQRAPDGLSPRASRLSVPLRRVLGRARFGSNTPAANLYAFGSSLAYSIVTL